MNYYSDFKQAFNTRFESFLRTKQNAYQEHSNHPHLEAYLQSILRIAQNGKRVRPYVAWITSDTPLEEVSKYQWNLCLALELIHLFALIHDDLIDQSSQRRGVPTSHILIRNAMKELGHSGDLLFAGRMTALLLGDLILWSAHEILARNADQAAYPETMRLFSHLIDGVTMGQMLDFDQSFREKVSREEILEKTKLKTAHYTFSYPMIIGSIMGKQSIPQKDLYSIGEHIGFAFQIQDDLLDIIGDPKKTKKPIMVDIASGQHTVMTDHIFTHGSDEQKQQLRSFWKKTPNEAETETLQTLFTDSGAIQEARNLAKHHYTQAQKITQSHPEIPASTKENLGSLIDYLANRDY